MKRDYGDRIGGGISNLMPVASTVMVRIAFFRISRNLVGIATDMTHAGRSAAVNAGHRLHCMRHRPAGQ